MKRFFLNLNIISLFAISFFAISFLVSCGNNGNNDNNDNTDKTTLASGNEMKDCVEIIYFHGKQRCVTCNAIEKLTKEIVEKDFSKDLEGGKLVFRIVDISKDENESIADKYEVSWSSLFINSWNSGNETRNNMTKFAFSYAKNSPEVFKDSIKIKLSELLNR